VIQIFLIKKQIQVVLLIFFLSIIFSLFSSETSAKIRIDVSRTYEITMDNRMLVQEVHTIRNNSENLWIPANENASFQILGFRISDSDESDRLKNALESARVTNELGTNLNFTSEMSENQVIIKVPYGTDLLPGEVRRFTFNYSHEGLIFRNGAIRDGYIHAFSPDFQFENANTEFNFETTMVFSKDMPEVNFVIPEPNSVNELAGKVHYNFSQQSLIDQFVWIQFGVEQNYRFEITQKISPTDERPTGFINRYEMVIPRDILGPIVNQRVYFDKIEPDPIGIYSDDLGNIIGVFEFSSHEEKLVTIDGYAVVSIDNHIELNELVTEISDISQTIVGKNIHTAPFWEVDAPEIKRQAFKIAPDETNVFRLTDEIYTFVIETIDYSTVKRFGINNRQGALATLNGGAAVCMEYSDLFLALMRARGVPTRAVFGYGYDPRVDSAEQEAHQWVQVYMPGVDAWIDVDVTWGESGDKLIGGDLNHFYTHVATVEPNTPPAFSRFGYSDGGELFAPEFKIETIEAIPIDLRLLSTPDGLLVRFGYEREGEFEFLLKQLKNSYILGIQSMRDGFDFSNKTQLTVIGTALVLGSLMFILLRIFFVRPRVRTEHNSSSIRLTSVQKL
jgi:hypothetical protein